MFQARYILILLLFITSIFCKPGFAEVVKTQEEKRADYILRNMQQDYITCYIFYKIGAEAIRRSKGETDIINGIEKSADNSLKLAFETGEILNMSAESMSAKVKEEMKIQSDEIQNDYSYASILLDKYGFMCKNLTQDKKQRIDFWEKKALNKFK